MFYAPVSVSTLNNDKSGFSATARRMGVYSATATSILLVLYAIALGVGFLSLSSPEETIGDPVFSILEILIVLMMPAMVCLMVAVHSWAPTQAKVFSLTALVFMSLVAVVTCCLHFLILTLSRTPEFVSIPGLQAQLSFQWPSVAYALDVLAWDFFFALSMLFAAPVFSGGKLSLWIRTLMTISGVLAFAGLAGVVAGDMRLRNIGIMGYVGAFLPAVVLLGVLFYTADTDSKTADNASD